MDRRTSEFIIGVGAKSRNHLATARGDYRIWRSPAGAEVWLHYPSREARTGGRSTESSSSASQAFDPVGDLLGMTIFHAGSSRVDMRLSKSMRIAPENPLDGLAIGVLPSRRAKEKPIALSFELLGFAAEPIVRPVEARVELTALAQRIWAYPTETAYLAATPPRRLIAKGAIANVSADEVPDVELIYRPKAGTLWLLTGEVRRSVRLVNAQVSAPYYLIDLETDRGRFDVVANPDVISGDISTGHVLQTVASLTGRVLERHG